MDIEMSDERDFGCEGLNMPIPPDLCPLDPAGSFNFYDSVFCISDEPQNTSGTDLTVPGLSHDYNEYLEIFNGANNCLCGDWAFSGWNAKDVGSYGLGADQWLSSSRQNCLNPHTQIYPALHTSWAENASLPPNVGLDSWQDDTYRAAFGELISSPMGSGYSSKPNKDSFDGGFERLSLGGSYKQAYTSLQGYLSPSMTPTTMPLPPPRLNDNGQLTHAYWPNVWPQNTPIIASSRLTAADATCDWQVHRNSLHSIVPSLETITDAHSSSSDSVLTSTQNPASEWHLDLHRRNSATHNMFKISLEKPSKRRVRQCFGPEKRRKVASVRDSRACILCRVNKSEVGKIALSGVY
jgi:hypothetical protein